MDLGHEWCIELSITLDTALLCPLYNASGMHVAGSILPHQIKHGIYEWVLVSVYKFIRDKETQETSMLVE